MMQLSQMPNIGPVLAGHLSQSGIQSGEELCALGAEQAFLRLRERQPDACFHTLTALEGAVRGVRKTQLSQERKKQLRQFFEGLPGAE